MKGNYYTITEVARRARVAVKTLIRWEKAGKISSPKRNWRGWRIYTDDDLAEAQQLRNTLYDAAA